MNGPRAKWLKDRIEYDDTYKARMRYKIAKKWWESLSHLQRKTYAHCRKGEPLYEQSK